MGHHRARRLWGASNGWHGRLRGSRRKLNIGMAVVHFVNLLLILGMLANAASSFRGIGHRPRSGTRWESWIREVNNPRSRADICLSSHYVMCVSPSRIPPTSASTSPIALSSQAGHSYVDISSAGCRSRNNYFFHPAPSMCPTEHRSHWYFGGRTDTYHICIAQISRLHRARAEPSTV